MCRSAQPGTVASSGCLALELSRLEPEARNRQWTMINGQRTTETVAMAVAKGKGKGLEGNRPDNDNATGEHDHWHLSRLRVLFGVF